jgi:hypothetical protein
LKLEVTESADVAKLQRAVVVTHPDVRPLRRGEDNAAEAAVFFERTAWIVTPVEKHTRGQLRPGWPLVGQTVSVTSETRA